MTMVNRNMYEAWDVANYFNDRITCIAYTSEYLQLNRYSWPVISYDEAYNLLKKVFANYKKTDTPDLVLMNERELNAAVGLCATGNPAAAFYSYTDHTINCRPDCLTVETILHEAAHALTPAHSASHGRTFRKKRDVLLRRHAKVNPQELPGSDAAMDWLERKFDKAMCVFSCLRAVASYEQKETRSSSEWRKKLIQELEFLKLQMEHDKLEVARGGLAAYEESEARFFMWRQAQQARREKLRKENEAREKKQAEERARREKLRKERAKLRREQVKIRKEQMRKENEALREEGPTDAIMREKWLREKQEKLKNEAA